MVASLTYLLALTVSLPAVLVAVNAGIPENSFQLEVPTTAGAPRKALLIDWNVAKTVSGKDAQFWFSNGELFGKVKGSPQKKAFISFRDSEGGCTDDGILQFFSLGEKINDCAKSEGFGATERDYHWQLVSKLTFGESGGFYNCEGVIYYSKTGGELPGCTNVPIYLKDL